MELQVSFREPQLRFEEEVTAGEMPAKFHAALPKRWSIRLALRRSSDLLAATQIAKARR
jgi:hypothetical protein